LDEFIEKETLAIDVAAEESRLKAENGGIVPTKKY
jgi:hypothetical protein